ncbi:unnamed protein product, partial [marine sediment metagenome]
MDFPWIINYEKFQAFSLIRKHNVEILKDPGKVIQKALALFAVEITKEEIAYMQKNFKKLEREFKKEK